MRKFRIPSKVIEEGKAFALKVWAYRGRNPDKFLMSQNQELELQSDIKGFKVEFAHCYAFNLPYPELFEGRKVDSFDCYMAVPNQDGFLQLFKFDIKTSKDLLINQVQFKRKKVDAYLFEELEFLDFENNVIFLKIIGWIRKRDVISNSDLVEFSNGSKAYKVNPKALKSGDLLFGLLQGREN